MCRIVVVALFVLGLVSVSAGIAGADPGADPTAGLRPGPGWWPDPGAQPRYDVPVTGAVVRGFEPPGTTYGPGHRGVDLAAAPHEAVRSAASGRVLFAGPVAGTRWVAIFHVDGVVTSYGPLGRVEVEAGSPVARAQTIGTLAAGGHGFAGQDEGLHWGARRDGRYLDPRSLLTQGIPRPSLVGGGGWTGAGHVVVPYAPWQGARLGGAFVASSPVAQRRGFAVPPNPNHLVLVPGLASSSRSVVFDADHLGYDTGSVTHFSYAGRRESFAEAALDPGDPHRDQRTYDAEDTWAGTGPAAARLAAQLRAQARREPGRAVDLIGHSMGGVVILRYLLEHHDPYDRTLPPIGNIVTLASPFHGSDLASIGRSVRSTPLLGEVIGWLQRSGRLGGDRLALDAPAVSELSVGSEMLWELAVAWERALDEGTAGAMATGTRVLTIGGSRDLVVSSERARQPDTFMHAGAPADLGAVNGAGGEVGVPRSAAAQHRHPEHGDTALRLPPGIASYNGMRATIDGEVVVDHRVLPGGHSGVLETEAAREVAWRFLAGAPVTQSPGHVSRLVGGTLADGARTGVEAYNLLGPLPRILRDPDRAVPVAPP